MALCSSTYNPLVDFTKHTYGDRESYRDRLVSKGHGAGREGFRRGRYNDHAQIANDFIEFNNPSGFLPPTYSAAYQVDSWQDEPILKCPGDSDALAWSSEFRASYFNSQNTTPVAKGHILYPINCSTSYSRDLPVPRINAHADSEIRSMGSTMVGPLHSTAEAFRMESSSYSQLLRSANQPQTFPSGPMLEDVDWEAIFQSLEPSTKEPGVELPESNHSLEEQEIGHTPHVEDYIGTPHNQLSSMRSVTNYIFHDENPFSEIPNPFHEGMRIIHEDGNLSFAALAFEAACQSDHYHLEAWRMLGSVQSENEREDAAIKALEVALSLDPQNLDVMIKLAVSYTNEGLDDLAYDCLEKWLRTKYPHLPVVEDDSYIQFSSDRHAFERIKNSFIQAAQYSSTSESIDPDVQVGLGVLMFSDENYEMGADCFASAIHSITPGATNAESQLHLLWNRYGACLGNMGKHEEAIEAYEMALAIRPNFIRARCNLGLLYYNKNDAVMGARNILQALQAHRAGETRSKQDMLKIVRVGTSHGRLEELTYGAVPLSIYDSLKKCCNSLCRWDLAEAVGPDMDLRKFQMELENL